MYEWFLIVEKFSLTWLVANATVGQFLEGGIGGGFMLARSTILLAQDSLVTFNLPI